MTIRVRTPRRFHRCRMRFRGRSRAVAEPGSAPAQCRRKPRRGCVSDRPRDEAPPSPTPTYRTRRRAGGGRPATSGSRPPPRTLRRRPEPRRRRARRHGFRSVPTARERQQPCSQMLRRRPLPRQPSIRNTDRGSSRPTQRERTAPGVHRNGSREGRLGSGNVCPSRSHRHQVAQPCESGRPDTVDLPELLDGSEGSVRTAPGDDRRRGHRSHTG